MTLLQLSYHAIDIQLLLSTSLLPQIFERLFVSGLQSFLSSSIHQPTLHPHFYSFSDSEGRAFGNEKCRDLRVPCTNNFVEKRLKYQSASSHMLSRKATEKHTSQPMGLFFALLISSSSLQSRLLTSARSLIHQ